MQDEIIPSKKKLRHNYTSELELKSLLIRVKNKGENVGTVDDNRKINKYIKWYTAINNEKKHSSPSKRKHVKTRLKNKIIELSEQTLIDKESFERFGSVILTMIKNILTKPQFSGYTYKDDFYSDAIYKILKYLHNFNHKLISKRTGLPVNSFSYISQYIHNSIIYIIKLKKKESDDLRKLIIKERLGHNIPVHLTNWEKEDKEYNFKREEKELIEEVTLREVKTNLVDVIKELEEDIEKVTRMNIIYPEDYRISFEEYNELKPLLKGKVSITRYSEPEALDDDE